MLRQKITTALSVLKNDGPLHVARVSIEKAGLWWRHGDPLSPGKFIGRPSAVARLDGCRFRLDTPEVSDDLRYLLLSGKHEKPERLLVRKYVNPDLPLVDLGGALGVVSCVANKLLTRPEQHVVVEANPALIPVLLGNRDRNGCRFKVLNRAIGYDRSVIRLHLNKNVLMSSVHGGTEDPVDVPATTLRRILDDHGFRRCTLICDIEGAEVELVRHEARTLSTCVETLIMEVHDRLVGDEECAVLFETLEQAGFRVAERTWDSVAYRNIGLRG
jgi:FkbM family methyltransferase